MAILRNRSQSGFTVITNNIFSDQNLSNKAIGMLCKMLSLPDNWNFSEKGLQAIMHKDGQASIRSGLKELQDAGYLRRYRVHDENGRFTGWEWEITNNPSDFQNKKCENPQVENPSMVNPSSETPNLENQPQVSTKEESTKLDKTNGVKTEKERGDKSPSPDSENPDNQVSKKRGRPKVQRHKYGEFGNVLLSDDEFERLSERVEGYREHYIKQVDCYCEQHGRTYKRYYATIVNWFDKDKKAGRLPDVSKKQAFMQHTEEENEESWGWEDDIA